MQRPRTLDDVRKFRLLARKAAKLRQRAAAARALRRNEREMASSSASLAESWSRANSQATAMICAVLR